MIKYNVQFEVLKGIPHQEVIERIKRADIALGQFYAGWYGNFDIECMIYGKPVFGYINPDLLEPGMDIPPLINIETHDFEEELYAKLEELIKDPELRKRIGIQSREYAVKIHDHIHVAERLKSLFGQIV